MKDVNRQDTFATESTPCRRAGGNYTCRADRDFSNINGRRPIHERRVGPVAGGLGAASSVFVHGWYIAGSNCYCYARGYLWHTRTFCSSFHQGIESKADCVAQGKENMNVD